MINLKQEQHPTYREEVAALATELAALAALDVPLAVRPEHAALVWTVEQCGGIVDLLTGDIDWAWEVRP